jgi:3-oxoacyl-[acyl-carrier-protein] synthase III
MIRISEACNSSGHAIARVLSGDFDGLIDEYNPHFSEGVPANIVLMALDDANRFADKGGDPLSPQFFSTGAAAMVWKYHPESPSSLKKIVHRSMSEERGTEYLLVPRPYDDWAESEKANLYTARYLKAPNHPGPIDMDPRASGAFVTYAMRLAEEVIADYGEQGGNISDITRVIVHHPSKAVFDGVQKRMIRKGFREDQINWVIDEGNVPVATIPIAFGRQLDTLKSGNRVMFLSFGAGGEYTCFIADIGGVPPAPPCPNP